MLSAGPRQRTQQVPRIHVVAPHGAALLEQHAVARGDHEGAALLEGVAAGFALAVTLPEGPQGMAGPLSEKVDPTPCLSPAAR